MFDELFFPGNASPFVGTYPDEGAVLVVVVLLVLVDGGTDVFLGKALLCLAFCKNCCFAFCLMDL